jgi:hypothetical protein
MLLYSRPDVWNTLPGRLLAFISEWHGAQIFMLLMGISFALKKDQSIESAFLKAFGLIGYAYALNILKFDLPHMFGWLPQSFLSELQIDKGWHGYVQMFLLGDILQFAGIALMVLGIISRFRETEKIALWMSIGICFLSPLFWDATNNNAIINYTLQIIGGEPPRVFFPLLPWLVYPLLGLVFGRQLQRKEQWIGFDSFWIIGLGGMTLSAVVKYWLHISGFSSFYRTTALDTLIHVGFVLIALSVWHWISFHVKPNYLFKIFSYASKHITQIYLIQWPLIFWLLPIVGYQRSGFAGTIFLINLTSFLTLATSLLIELVKKKKTL